jgi:hypothetical protein
MRFLPRTRAARLAAELAEVRGQAERAEDAACSAAARIDEIFAEMERQTAAAGFPRRPALHVVAAGDRPGAA